VFYGRRVLSLLRDNGLVIAVIVVAIAILLLLGYTITNRRKPRAKEPDAEAE
jgi:ABC-type anion transport system duplicated permease subunit